MISRCCPRSAASCSVVASFSSSPSGPMMEKRPAALRCPAGHPHALHLCVCCAGSCSTQRPAVGPAQATPHARFNAACILDRSIGLQRIYCKREACRSVADRAGWPGGLKPMALEHSGTMQERAEVPALLPCSGWPSGSAGLRGSLAAQVSWRWTHCSLASPVSAAALVRPEGLCGQPLRNCEAGAHTQGLAASWSDTGEAARYGAVQNARGARSTGRKRRPQAPWQERTQQRSSLVRAQPPAALHAAVGRPGRRRRRRGRRAGLLGASGRAVCAGVFRCVLHTRSSKVLSLS